MCSSILSSDRIGSTLGFELFVHRFDFILDTFNGFEVLHCLDVEFCVKGIEEVFNEEVTLVQERRDEPAVASSSTTMSAHGCI